MTSNNDSAKSSSFTRDTAISDENLKRASEKFSNIINQLEYDFETPTDETEKDAGKKQIQDQLQRQAQERDAGFTELVSRFVEHYGDKYLQNKDFKDKFFNRVLLLFTCTLLSPFLIFFMVAYGAIDGNEVVAAFLSSLGAIITSIVVIPKIIAEYLFSLKEDETIIKIISELHLGDIQKIDPRKPPK